jgi:hypothetical protein
VTATVTVGWAVALVVLLSVRSVLPAETRWWIWTCVAGMAMGLFGLWYVPFLKRRRARAAEAHAGPVSAEPEPRSEAVLPVAGEAQPVAGEPQPVSGEPQPSSGYVSRDSGSNTVSSTETPGKSTRS